MVTDLSQAVVWQTEQTPFGEVTQATGTLAQPLRFPGQYADPETGYSYNYFRDYDPSVGRYVQSDPIGLRGGVNTYGYVYQNPILITDPTGEFGVVGGVLTVIGIIGTGLKVYDAYEAGKQSARKAKAYEEARRQYYACLSEKAQGRCVDCDEKALAMNAAYKEYLGGAGSLAGDAGKMMSNLTNKLPKFGGR